MNDAQEAKQNALDFFEVYRQEYLARARLVALDLFNKVRRPITVDDVREACPPPDYVDGRVMGALFSVKGWSKVGYINSKRRECHGRPIATFVPTRFKHEF